VCIVRGCSKPADRPGAARGYCTTHYHRWNRYGVCQALVQPCERPAIGHIGLCDVHEPEGIPA
jgi:hypothetical protein